MSKNPEYLTPMEVATRFKLSENTLAGWRMKSRGPKYLKLEGKILYKLEDVEKYEADSLVQPGK